MNSQIFTSKAAPRIVAAIVVVLTTACIGSLAPLHDAQAAQVSAVEFSPTDTGPHHHHFFLTTSPAEMALLERGGARDIGSSGWVRSNFEFKVDDAPGPGLVSVCRFYNTSRAPNGSHFFTAFPDECAAVKANPAWAFEGDAFYARLPDALGECVAGTMPIYRCYNGGIGGAPGHRFTPYLEDACSAFGAGSVREGLGPDGVAFCAPASWDLSQLRTQQMSGGTWEFSYVEGVPTIVRLSFGEAREDLPAIHPPQNWPMIPYSAHPIGAAGFAGWDPIAGKMVVMWASVIGGDDLFNMLLFDFDGVIATSGCAFLNFDIFSPDRGWCRPMTARRQ
jgi:hypothetical protein